MRMGLTQSADNLKIKQEEGILLPYCVQMQNHWSALEDMDLSISAVMWAKALVTWDQFISSIALACVSIQLGLAMQNSVTWINELCTGPSLE